MLLAPFFCCKSIPFDAGGESENHLNTDQGRDSVRLQPLWILGTHRLLCGDAGSSSDVENVLDLFGGSGSTLIAAQQTGRRAFLMELDPPYCDVIVERWERFTGQTASRDTMEALAWDFYFMLVDSNSPKPEVMDDDYIERFIDEKMKKSRTKPQVEKTRKNAPALKDEAHGRPKRQSAGEY